MRERHIFWDLAPVALLLVLVVESTILLIDNHRSWTVMQQLRDENQALAKQNHEILKELGKGITIRGGGADQTGPGLSPAPNPNPGNGGTVRNPGGPGRHPLYPDDPAIPPEALPQSLPKFVRGDENADDGDYLVESIRGEPNSLNSLVDNDATASDLFDHAHDSLATRDFDDLSIFVPRLAKAWTKELICYAHVKYGKAAELAAEIESKWDRATRERLKLRRIGTEESRGETLLKLEIGDVDNSYAEQLKKDFGDRIEPQWWFFINITATHFEDGQTEARSDRVAEWLLGKIGKPAGFGGRFAPSWNRESSVVLKLLGSAKDKELIEQRLKEIAASKENRGQIVDPKDPTGKRAELLITFDLIEDYLAQEKPVFTFYLRKDVKWDDGVPFTGKDLVFTFGMTKNEKVEAGPQRNYYQDCESCELVDGDPYRARIIWSKPYFAAFEFSAGMQPMAEHYYPKDPEQFNKGAQNQSLVGNGQYKLERWDRNKQIVFARNEEYYGHKPHFKKNILRVAKDPAVALQLLEAGELDILGMQPTQVLIKKNDPAFLEKCRISDDSIANVYRYLGWNARRPFFKDKRVRQALTMLTDRKRACEDIYRGYAKPQHGPMHPESPMYWKGIEAQAWPFDPKRAQALLDEAGWKDTDADKVRDREGVKFEFTLLIVSNSPEYESLANLIKDEFGKAGILVNINNLEWSAFLQKIERLQFDACILGWQLGLVDDPYQLWHSSQCDEKESNHCALINKEADRIIEASRRELDQEKRKKLLERFQQIIHEEQPYTFLFVPKRLVGYSKRIQNVKYKLVGSSPERWWVKQSEQRYK